MSDPSSFRGQRWTATDGLELYSRVYDAAPAGALSVLCLPGLTRNSRDFEALAPYLARRYRVVCPDLRGRGLSARDPQWRNYHPGVYVGDIERLMDVLELQRVAIIGTSLGGLLAMLLAAALPQRVAGIVVNDIGPQADPRGIERVRSYAGKLPPVRSWEEAIAQHRQVNGQAWPGLTDEQWAVLARRCYREDASGVPVFDYDPRIGELISAAPAVPADLWSVFSRLRAMPMLVIRGELSDILSLGILQRMQREKPDLESLTVPDRGHAPLLDEPQEIAAIDRFLKRLRGVEERGYGFNDLSGECGVRDPHCGSGKQ